MPEIQYPKNPNSDTAFVVQEDGTKNRALMTAPQDTSSLELPTNSNSCKGYVTVDGKKQRVILTADIGGGGGGSATYTAGNGIDIDAHNEISVTDPVLVNNATGSDSLSVLGGVTTAVRAIAIGKDAAVTTNYGIAIGSYLTQSAGGIALGQAAQTSGSGIAIGHNNPEAKAGTGHCSIAIGLSQKANVAGAIQIGTNPNIGINSDANTFKVSNENGNYEIMSADGTIPEARLADTTNAQQGDVLTLDSTGNAVWQAGGGGGGLPSQTGNAGKFLTTNGTDASWSDKPLVNKATGAKSLSIIGSSVQPNTRSFATTVGVDTAVYGDQATAIGSGATAMAFGTAVGRDSGAGGTGGIAIGKGTRANGNYSVQIGGGSGISGVNNDANTVKICNVNGNFEIMSADGTVPTARLTKVNTTATLTVAGWSNNEQTVSITGMTADGVVMVSPTPANQSAYTSAGILCTAQAAGSLTFTCDTVPSADITVTVVML
jgi:hypothetical protein